METAPTYPLCGVAIAAVSPEGAVATLVQRAQQREPFEVHLCNAYTLSLVAEDERLARSLARGDLNLPDGAPVAWFGRRAGTRGPVRGPALVARVADEGTSVGLRHYLYGGAEGVAQQVEEALVALNPAVHVVGAETPPWTDLDESELVALAERITASRADVVWIGLGTPRQDYLVPRLAPLVNCVVVPVGAAFDFLSGRVREAPAILHGSGFEWVYRLAKEPRRLWRRYLTGNPRFLVQAFSTNKQP